MKKLFLSILFLFLFVVSSFADTAKQVDFLLAGYRTPVTDEVLSGGKVYTYLDGTSTLSALWTDKDKGGFATNPIILDSTGKTEVYGNTIYRFEIYDSSDVLIETITGLEYKSISSGGSISNIDDLRAITEEPFNGQIVTVTGYYLSTENMGWQFQWDSSSSATDNGGTVFEPTNFPGGRWLRLFDRDVNVLWFGADPTGVLDSTDEINAASLFTQPTPNTTRWPWGQRAVLYFPAGDYKISGTLVQRSNQIWRGDDKRNTRISNLTTSDGLIEVGDKTDTASTGYPENTMLENLTFFGNTNSLFGIWYLGQDDVPTWGGHNINAEIHRVVVYDVDGGPAVKVENVRWIVDSLRITKCAYGIYMTHGEDCHIKLLATNDTSEYAIKLVNANVGVNDLVRFVTPSIQHHTGSAGKECIQIEAGKSIVFENAHIADNTGDIIVKISGDSNGSNSFTSVSFKNVRAKMTNDSPNTRFFQVDGPQYLTLEDIFAQAQMEYVVEFTNTNTPSPTPGIEGGIRQAIIKNVSQYSTPSLENKLQAIVHDATSDGSIEWNKGENNNILLNPGVRVVQDGTSFPDPATDDYVLDTWRISNIDGAGTGPVIDVSQSTVTPYTRVPYSIGLDVTNVGAPASDTSWKIYQIISDSRSIDYYKGKTISLGVMFRSDSAVTFSGGGARIRIQDGGTGSGGDGVTEQSITSLGTTWQTFFIRHVVSANATSLQFSFVPTLSGSTISTTALISLACPTLTTGADQPYFELRPLDEELRKVKYLYEKLDLTTAQFVANGYAATTGVFQAGVEYAQKVSEPTITLGGGTDFEMVVAGSNIPSTSVSASVNITKNRAVLVVNDSGAGLTAGQGGILRALNNNAYVEFDSRP